MNEYLKLEYRDTPILGNNVLTLEECFLMNPTD